MAWPHGTNDVEIFTEPREIKSKWWNVKTYYKKSCEQHEIFTHDDYSEPLIILDGFRFCEYNVETNDGEFPQFEFTEVPGVEPAEYPMNFPLVCVLANASPITERAEL